MSFSGLGCERRYLRIRTLAPHAVSTKKTMYSCLEGVSAIVSDWKVRFRLAKTCFVQQDLRSICMSSSWCGAQDAALQLNHDRSMSVVRW